jgi:hypothetical protein
MTCATHMPDEMKAATLQLQAITAAATAAGAWAAVYTYYGIARAGPA